MPRRQPRPEGGRDLDGQANRTQRCTVDGGWLGHRVAGARRQESGLLAQWVGSVTGGSGELLARSASRNFAGLSKAPPTRAIVCEALGRRTQKGPSCPSLGWCRSVDRNITLISGRNVREAPKKLAHPGRKIEEHNHREGALGPYSFQVAQVKARKQIHASKAGKYDSQSIVAEHGVTCDIDDTPMLLWALTSFSKAQNELIRLTP